MLLDRRTVKFWQKIDLRLHGRADGRRSSSSATQACSTGCTWFNSAQQDATQVLNQQIAKDKAATVATPADAAAWTALAEAYLSRSATADQGLRGAQTADLNRRGGRVRQGRQAARQAEGPGGQGAAAHAPPVAGVRVRPGRRRPGGRPCLRRHHRAHAQGSAGLPPVRHRIASRPATPTRRCLRSRSSSSSTPRPPRPRRSRTGSSRTRRHSTPAATPTPSPSPTK